MKTKVNHIRNGYDVYIGRARYCDRLNNDPITYDTDLNYLSKIGYFSNPYKLEPNAPKGATLPQFRKYFYHRLKTDDVFKHHIHQLKGKQLGCFCSPSTCHGSIICEYLNKIYK